MPGGTQMRVRTLPSVPHIVFNSAAIQLGAPRSVRAILYQHFTPRVSRSAAVTVVHDLIFLSSPELFGSRERAYLSLIPRLLPSAAIVATVSEHVRSQVLDRWPRRDPESVIVAPNGVSEELIKAGSVHLAGTRAGSGTAPRLPGIKRPYVLYLGRLNVRKNLPRLIEAFAHARVSEHDLVIAGAPSGVSEDLHSVASRWGVADRVTFLGRVDEGDLGTLYAGASAFAYVPFDEGFGVPPLEAMAFGVPVVCSDIPTLRELAGPGGAKLVSAYDTDEIASALEQAVGDGAFRRKALALGPDRAAHFRWLATADVLESALERAVR